MIATPEKIESANKPLVFFVHGFLSKRLLMKPLEWQVASFGFKTVSWGYLSFVGSLKQHATRLRPTLEKLCAENETVNIVAHSMGSIVLRLAMQMGPLPNLGRIVLMAPPNQGTPTARIVNPLFCLFFKGVSELSDRPNSLVNQIETRQDMDLGIIAGHYDWIVPKSRTPLESQRDHICLHSTHNTMLVMPSAARQVAEYLAHGEFARSARS